MVQIAIDPVWYENGRRGYTIGNVDYAQCCYAADGDEFSITLSQTNNNAKLSYTDKSGASHPTDKETFWNNAAAVYDPDTGIITGSSSVNNQTRSFSIALARHAFAVGFFQIHVYVSARKTNPPQPDDGSWTGNGR